MSRFPRGGDAGPSEMATGSLTTQPLSMMRRNYRLGVLNGVLFTLGDSLTSAGLVLALLVRQLGGSLALVGLLPAIQSGGYLLPQLFISGYAQALTYKLPLYRRAAMMRLVACFILTVAIFAAAAVPPDVSLWSIVVTYTVFNLGSGTSTLAFQDVVAKTIPVRRRGRFFGARQLFGGLLSFVVAGVLVRWLLSGGGPLPFPANFGALSVLSLLCYVLGMYAFSRIDEPFQAYPGPRRHVFAGLQLAPMLLRGNDRYRWFIISRVITRVGQIAEPFYIIYATEVLRLPSGVAGAYLAVRAMTGALSNVVWGRLSDQRGSRRLVVVSGLLVALTPALALVGPVVALVLGLGTGGFVVAMGVVFLVSGAANDGSNIAGNTYLLEVVPEDERSLYMGLANTILGVVTLLPVLGGWVVGVVGYEWTFGLSLLFALLGVVASLRLGESGSVGGGK